MSIDRLDVRQRVGAAVKRIEAAEKAYLKDIDGERVRLHKRWRDLLDQAHAAQAEYERCTRGLRTAAAAADKAVIAHARKLYPDLLVYEEHPDEAPVLCAATGLAVFEGDELYGDSPQYGPVILRAAVELKLPAVEDA